MSTAVISTSAATSCLFVSDDEADPEVYSLSSISYSGRASLDRTAGGGCPYISFQSTIKNQNSTVTPTGNRKLAIGNFFLVIPASHLEIRPAPEMVSSGIPALDALTGGLPRGCLTEICGPASSGRTTVLLAVLAAATCRGEFCAAVDASDALDPQSVAAAGVELDRLLWVRCSASPPEKTYSPRKHGDTEESVSEDRIHTRNMKHQAEHRLEQVLRATDLLLASGGFGLIVLDLGDLPSQAARRIPLTTWFRFRRAVEHTPMLLLAIEQQASAGSCSSLLLQLGPPDNELEASAEQENHWGLDANNSDESAATWRKDTAHGVSRGLDMGDNEAPEGRKKICRTGQTIFDFSGPTHARLLTGLNITVELIRSRLNRKPARSTTTFATKTAWAE